MLLVTEAPAPKTRLTSLDAVRGIAACVVVLAHCYLTIPEQRRAGLASLLWPRALGFLHNGDAAVVVFFVLSGYVLALPYFRGTQPSYPRYVIRRVCRIYIPFPASILFSLLLYNLTSHQHAPAASEWFNTLWPTASPGPAVLARHFLMIGTVPDIALNESMWTLVHEMRIS